MLILLAAAAAVQTFDPNDGAQGLVTKRLDPITVTASLEPVPLDLSGTAVTVIDHTTIDALALPLVKDYLTLSPSVSVSVSGPLGAQTQVRIRGAEANHTLTFIDGIDVTDPASSGEFRYETLLADGIDRIEILRGPQSALWGSEAIGGVVNILTDAAPRGGHALYGEAEGGSLGTFRGGVGGGVGSDTAGFSAQGSYLKSRGYDISSSNGDRDGYENFTLYGKGFVKPTENTQLTVAARYADAISEFDDFDYGAGVPLDAPLSTKARLFAVRGAGSIDLLDGRSTSEVAAAFTDTANINRTAGVFQNESDGGRIKLTGQTSLKFDTGDVQHRVTAAAEWQRERFVSIDADPTAFSNQRQNRTQTSAVGEYRLDVADRFGGGVAVRRDWNNRFANDTTVRVNGAAKLGGGFGLHASYGSGVANPTFYDEFGFFPGFFVGNPNLKPEKSQSYDAGAGWSRGTTKLDVTWYRANLTDEIVSTFDSTTFLSGVANAVGRSRRQGLEVTAETAPIAGLRLAATYAYLDATQQQVAAGLQIREVRRPRHSGSLTASYTGAAFDLAASAAITGARTDTDFATFQTVTLKSYTLLTISGAWHINRHIDLTGRVENALDTSYQDVFAYRTPRLTAYAGVRLRL